MTTGKMAIDRTAVIINNLCLFNMALSSGPPGSLRISNTIVDRQSCGIARQNIWGSLLVFDVSIESRRFFTPLG